MAEGKMSPAVLIIRGILAAILGLLLAFWPGASLEVILILFPIFAFIDGTSAIIIGNRSTKGHPWRAFIPMGIIEILIGILVLFWPQATITAFIYLMAIWAFVLGLLELYIALQDKTKTFTKWTYSIGAIITFILGILVICYPLMTSLVIIWLFGLFFLIYGLVLLIAGLIITSKISSNTK